MDSGACHSEQRLVRGGASGVGGRREPQAVPDRALPRSFPAIQDEAAWLRRVGLEGEPHYGDESYANQQEAIQREEEHREYQQHIHEKFFLGDTADNTDQSRKKHLESWKEESIHLIASTSSPSTPGTSTVVRCNLEFLASHSETVYTMAQSRHNFQEGKQANLTLSLHGHTDKVVLSFVELLSRVVSHDYEKDVLSQIPEPDFLVEYCEIAHFLQCTELIDNILLPVLLESVDSANCMSLCQLADQLSMPTLLEASMNHMMRTLGSLEEHEVWDDLTPELRERIETIRSILTSSNRKQIFFSSFDEYLAMFAEQVDYYRERLEDAQHQQLQHSKNTPAWLYAQSKILEQMERVRVLKMVLQEQKKLFRGKQQ